MADDEIPQERTFPAINVEAAQRRAREKQEQFLAESVMREDMTPVEADALAAGLGINFDGQHWPAAIGDPYWPLAFAILWVSWRDPESVARQWDRFRVWAGRLWRDPRHGSQVESLSEAEVQLWRALESGKVRAVGLPFTESDTIDIPAVQWRNLQWMPDQKLISVRNFGQIDARYRCVDVESASVLAVWPAPGIQAPEAVDEVVRQLAPQISPPTRRGGGAPQQYDWDAMWIEVVRLATEDKITDRPSLSRHLRQWFLDTTGDEPGDTIFKAKMAKLFTTLKW